MTSSDGVPFNSQPLLIVEPGPPVAGRSSIESVSVAVLVPGEALGLTAVAYHFYENPIRKSDWLLDEMDRDKQPVIGPRGWGLVGGMTAAAVVVSILGIRYDERLPEITAEEQPITVASTGAPVEIDPCFGAPAMPNPQCELRNPDIALQPSIDDFAQDYQRQLSCYRKEGEHQVMHLRVRGCRRYPHRARW